MQRALLGGCLALAAVFAAGVGANEVYQTPEAFLQQVFDEPPAPAALWLDRTLQPKVRAILGHDYPALRLRYWLHDGRSAWVLDEVGKERPITVGIVVGPDGIERLKVLTYRESRGFEVRHAFFTDQFRGARLADGQRLDRPIDSIAGATLSVRALTRLGALALLLHAQVTDAG